ncbi:DinB family protein [Halalkalibacter urbisdiaboli]|uniref:DinB family protein n=1 Tax=Halalkalibacter urbisdiaboli TaxID=1960589 RepID=UPI000B43D431|nr:DinB family protein [Halalkalibacter urbisdiaboli]
MENYLMKQLLTARESTINYVKDMEEAASELVPDKLNNNVKWNLGHIYVVGEKFLFHLTGEETKIPSNYPTFFKTGTSPANWKMNPPFLEELLDVLSEQMIRMNLALSGRMDEKVKEPYTTSTGFELTTVKELVSFCLYHEGMHFGAIKNISKLVKEIS